MEKFCNFRGMLSEKYENSNCVIYSVPFDCNASISCGAKEAPGKLKELSAWLPPYTMDGKPISNIKIFVQDEFKINKFSDIEKASSIFFDDKLKIILGGDHSISIPFQKEFISYCQFKNKEPVIVHIDAHCDICDEYFGCNTSHACTVRRSLDNGLKEENLIMIGVREFEKDGYDFLISNSNRVNLFTALTIHETGLNDFYTLLKKYSSNEFLIYVSFDIDALDCAYAPGTGTPETCGLTPLQVRKILIALAKLGNVLCLDLVEVAPPLDVNDITSWSAIKLIYEFFGYYKFGDNK